MPITLAVLASLIVGLSAYGMLMPAKITVLVRSAIAGSGLWAGVSVRMLLAVLLWFTAPLSHTPFAFKALAALALASGVALPIIGTRRLLKVVDRLVSWPTWVLRLLSLLGIAFGAFLLWSISLTWTTLTS